MSRSNTWSAVVRPLEILDDVSLTLASGENLAIVGPSGSGKSTLLAILGTLDQPTRGTVTLDGIDPTTLDEKSLAEFRSQQIGFVFQDHHLLPQCTVLENVLVPFLADGASGCRASCAGRKTARTCRALGASPASAGPAFRRRKTACRHCPGAGTRTDASASRRTDRQPRPGNC